VKFDYDMALRMQGRAINPKIA